MASPTQATFLFLAWRCLYAEIQAERLDDRPASLDRALARFAALLISRLKAYGLRWKAWSEKNRNSGHLWVIPERHRDKQVLKQDFDGSYTIHPKLFKFHEQRLAARVRGAHGRA